MSIPTYEIEIKGLEEQIRRLNAYDENSTKELTTAMNQSVVTLESAIKPLAPVYRGRLRGSIASEVKQEGVGSIVGKVGSTLKNEEYPAVMEFGRTPGSKMPPLEPLIRWVHLKQIAGNYRVKATKTGKHTRVGTKDVQTAQDEQAAYVIARSIARKGIKGLHFMSRGFDASKMQINEYFTQALKRITDALENK
jgi:hypothetical protein